MPSIKPDKNGGVIIFDKDDFVNGFAPQGGKTGLDAAHKIGPGFGTATNFDPYDNYGYAQPGKIAENPTNNNLVTGTVVAWITKTANIAYLLTNDGKFFEFNYTGTFAVTSDATFPHTIAHGAHTSPVGQDALIYKHNVGGTPTFSAFYSFYDNTDWDVGRFDLSATFDDDFMSNVPATPLSGADLTDGQGVPHPMCIGADDVLYIGSGRYLHGYDGSEGANGTFYSKLISLPQGFIITSLMKTNESLLIGGVYTGSGGISEVFNGQAFVYPWNYLDQDITTAYDCEDSYLASLIMFRGSPAVITTGAFGGRGNTRLKTLVGDRFDTIAELPTLYSPINRGVDVVNNIAYINVLGKIYTVGNPFDNSSNAVNQLCSCSSLSASGVVKNAIYSASSIQVLYASGGNEISRFLAKKTNSFSFISILSEPSFNNFQQGRVTQVVVYFKDAGAGRLLTLNLITNGGALSTSVFDSISSVTGTPIKKYHYDYAGAPLPSFKSLAIQLLGIGGTNTTAIEVSKIEVYYENVNYES